MREILTFWMPFIVAISSLLVNVVQLVGYRRVKNKITVWAKDAKGMTSAIVDIQRNIKSKKIVRLPAVSSNIETLGNFANSMFLSMEEELGRTKREITLDSKKAAKKKKNHNHTA